MASWEEFESGLLQIQERRPVVACGLGFEPQQLVSRVAGDAEEAREFRFGRVGHAPTRSEQIVVERSISCRAVGNREVALGCVHNADGGALAPKHDAGVQQALADVDDEGARVRRRRKQIAQHESDRGGFGSGREEADVFAPVGLEDGLADRVREETEEYGVAVGIDYTLGERRRRLGPRNIAGVAGEQIDDGRVHDGAVEVGAVEERNEVARERVRRGHDVLRSLVPHERVAVVHGVGLVRQLEQRLVPDAGEAPAELRVHDVGHHLKDEDVRAVAEAVEGEGGLADARHDRQLDDAIFVHPPGLGAG